MKLTNTYTRLKVRIATKDQEPWETDPEDWKKGTEYENQQEREEKPKRMSLSEEQFAEMNKRGDIRIPKGDQGKIKVPTYISKMQAGQHGYCTTGVLHYDKREQQYGVYYGAQVVPEIFNGAMELYRDLTGFRIKITQQTWRKWKRETYPNNNQWYPALTRVLSLDKI